MLPLGPCQSGWPSPQPGVMVTPRSRMLQRAVSGTMVLLQPRSVLKFMTFVTIKDQVNARVLGLNLWSFWSLRAIPQSGHYRSKWPLILSGHCNRRADPDSQVKTGAPHSGEMAPPFTMDKRELALKARA